MKVADVIKGDDSKELKKGGMRLAKKEVNITISPWQGACTISMEQYPDDK